MKPALSSLASRGWQASALARPVARLNRLLRWLLIGAAAAVLVVSLWTPGAVDLPATITLGLVLAVSEALAVRRPGVNGTVSLSFIPLAAAVFIAGPTATLLLAVASTLLGDGALRRRSWRQLLDQTSLLVLMLAFGAWAAGVSVAGSLAPAGVAGVVMIFWSVVFLWWSVAECRQQRSWTRGCINGAVPPAVLLTVATQSTWVPVVVRAPFDMAWTAVSGTLMLAAAFMLVDTVITAAGRALTAGSGGLGIWRTALLPAYYQYTGQALGAAGVIAVHQWLGVGGLALGGAILLLAFALYRLHAQKEELFVAGLAAFAAALDAKDTYTQGHSDRVARYSLAIATAMRIGGRRLRTLQLAAQLHDIGKIGIPDAVLLKPGKFTPEEFEVMKGHVQKGVDILWNVPALRDAARLVEQEHERWDGSGYPRGLKGEEIAAASRIIAVADTFDALTSDRPYRKGMGADAAVGILRDAAGVDLDPEPVRVLADLSQRNDLDAELAFGYCFTH